MLQNCSNFGRPRPGAIPADPRAIPADPRAIPADPRAIPAEPRAIPAEPRPNGANIMNVEIKGNEALSSKQAEAIHAPTEQIALQNIQNMMQTLILESEARQNKTVVIDCRDCSEAEISPLREYFPARKFEEG